MFCLDHGLLMFYIETKEQNKILTSLSYFCRNYMSDLIFSPSGFKDIRDIQTCKDNLV